MVSLFIALGAVLFNSHLFRVLFLITCANVVFHSALGALEGNPVSHFLHLLAVSL